MLKLGKSYRGKLFTGQLRSELGLGPGGLGETKKTKKTRKMGGYLGEKNCLDSNS